MKLQVDKLSSNKEVAFSEDWGVTERDLQVPGVEFQSVIHVEVRASKDADVVKVDVVTRAPVFFVCARCFNNVDGLWDKKYQLIYEVESPHQVILLDEDIRQEIILDIPLQVLCSTNCRGLCGVCGQDLNQKRCACKEK